MGGYIAYNKGDKRLLYAIHRLKILSLAHF